MDAKTGTSHAPNRDVSRPKEFENFPRNTRPSLIKKEKSAKPNLTATEIAVDASLKTAYHGETSPPLDGTACAAPRVIGKVH